MEFVVISGLSGAGKSSVADILEDTGFTCVDNLPIALIGDFVRHCLAEESGGAYAKVALVTDARGGQEFDGLFAGLAILEQHRIPVTILFIEASGETVVKRYKETRHAHPLSHTGYSLTEAVERERMLLSPVRAAATHVVDTTSLSHAKLRAEILRLLGYGKPSESMQVTVVSFGFKYGIPIESDLLFDVRFLPNPHYEAQLRPLSGLDTAVQEFIYAREGTRHFMELLEGLLAFLLPQYVEEGKAALVIGIGCTGGRHRSVCLTHALCATLREKGVWVKETHRDMGRH